MFRRSLNFHGQPETPGRPRQLGSIETIAAQHRHSAGESTPEVQGFEAQKDITVPATVSDIVAECGHCNEPAQIQLSLSDLPANLRPARGPDSVPGPRAGLGGQGHCDWVVSLGGHGHCDWVVSL